jgi:copper chaperone CopZ
VKKFKLTIEGMHCASCVGNIERSVRTIKGIKNISVSVLTKKSFIEAEEYVNPEEIKLAVKKAGYEVSAIQ